jgi:hypothetical protein
VAMSEDGNEMHNAPVRPMANACTMSAPAAPRRGGSSARRPAWPVEWPRPAASCGRYPPDSCPTSSGRQ